MPTKHIRSNAMISKFATFVVWHYARKGVETVRTLTEEELIEVAYMLDRSFNHTDKSRILLGISNDVSELRLQS